jgi:hypothetical protein
MAPTESVGQLSTRTIAVILVVAAAAIWIALANMPRAPPQQVKVVKINATPPQPQQQQPQPQSAVSLFMCQGNAFRTSSGITVCGVDLVTDQYIFIKHGWIYAQNSTSFSLSGDVSSCRFSLSAFTLYVNCTSDIMVAR